MKIATKKTLYWAYTLLQVIIIFSFPQSTPDFKSDNSKVKNKNISLVNAGSSGASLEKNNGTTIPFSYNSVLLSSISRTYFNP